MKMFQKTLVSNIRNISLQANITRAERILFKDFDLI